MGNFTLQEILVISGIIVVGSPLLIYIISRVCSLGYFNTKRDYLKNLTETKEEKNGEKG